MKVKMILIRCLSCRLLFLSSLVFRDLLKSLRLGDCFVIKLITQEEGKMKLHDADRSSLVMKVGGLIFINSRISLLT